MPPAFPLPGGGLVVTVDLSGRGLAASALRFTPPGRPKPSPDRFALCGLWCPRTPAHDPRRYDHPLAGCRPSGAGAPENWADPDGCALPQKFLRNESGREITPSPGGLALSGRGDAFSPLLM